MIGLQKYISDIKKKAVEHLRSEYNIDIFSLTDFELINFFLLDQAINKDHNVFIKTLDNEQKSDIYLPTLVSVAISLFFKNFCENTYSYKVGDILQKKGTRYKITAIKKEKYELEYIYKGTVTTVLDVTKSNLDKNYIITNSTYRERKVKTKLNDYRNLFKAIFNTDKFPSVFTRKAVVIIEKKDFLNELKAQSFSSKINLAKAIPYQWVNKNGKFETTPIPVDPMIYLVPDYETFKSHIFDSNIKIDAIIAIGKNKYQPDTFRQIKRDLREEEIPFAIVIGNENIDDEFELFKMWDWTAPEITLLHDSKEAVISIIQIPEDNFQKKIDGFEAFIENTNQKYDIKLSNFNGFKKLLYSLVLPGQNSRLKNQINYLRYAITKGYSEEIDTALFNQNIDPKEQIFQLESITEELINSFSNSKLAVINEQEFDFIVVPKIPKDTAEIWIEESTIKTLSYEMFLTRIDNATTQKTFLFLSPFGYIPPQELFQFIKTTSHKYFFLAYHEEEKVIANLEKRYENSLIAELNSTNRKSLSGISFPFKEQPEEVSDLIDRIEGSDSERSADYFYEGTTSVNYLMDFEAGESLVLDGNKSVLIENNGQKRRIKVSSLVAGDQVRIYSNLSKDLLFETARKQDVAGRFSEIEEHSRFWKKCLHDYYIQNGFEHSEAELLKALQNEGISIKSPSTLKNWLNPKSSVKFPHKQRDLLVINRTIKNKSLETKISAVLKSRSTYNGIMIALGRDLSDEVMEFIMNKSKGLILGSFSESEIQSFVNTSAPLRKVKNIQITEEDESE